MDSLTDTCPVCSGPSVLHCRCLRSHHQCASGHEWHRCLIHDRVITGPADHAREGCTCPRDSHPLLGPD